MLLPVAVHEHDLRNDNALDICAFRLVRRKFGGDVGVLI
jgi:hypothetical protein